MLEDLVKDEAARRTAFPVVQEGVFLAHAGVAPLPRVAVEAIHACVLAGSRAAQENPEVGATVSQARADAARLLGAAPEEISLVGPTSLGLSMVARGLAWQPGDEVVYYAEDYPANVYPWTALAHWGVKPAPLQPEYPGVITWDVVERALGERTRLVALASCHFLSGHRIDVAGIGQALHDRGVLFSLDAIQSLGAFPMDVRYVDFLSADSHKWLLGPCGAGIFYVKQSRKEQLAPMVLGAGNVACPEFVAQDTLSFDAGARRYEPGALNLAGICGMGASLRLLLDCGVEAVGTRILELRRYFVERLRARGYQLYLDEWDRRAAAGDAERSGIITVQRPGTDMKAVFVRLKTSGVTASLRRNRAGATMIRFSPHFYNTEEEFERAVAMM